MIVEALFCNICTPLTGNLRVMKERIKTQTWKNKRYNTALHTTMTNERIYIAIHHRRSFMILNCSKKILESNPWIFGIFVPISTGHMPIDFRQMMK